MVKVNIMCQLLKVVQLENFINHLLVFMLHQLRQLEIAKFYIDHSQIKHLVQVLIELYLSLEDMILIIQVPIYGVSFNHQVNLNLKDPLHKFHLENFIVHLKFNQMQLNQWNAIDSFRVIKVYVIIVNIKKNYYQKF